MLVQHSIWTGMFLLPFIIQINSGQETDSKIINAAHSGNICIKNKQHAFIIFIIKLVLTASVHRSIKRLYPSACVTCSLLKQSFNYQTTSRQIKRKASRYSLRTETPMNWNRGGHKCRKNKAQRDEQSDKKRNENRFAPSGGGG